MVQRARRRRTGRAAATRCASRAVLVPAEPGHHAVGGALVLDLEHRPLAGLVRRRRAAWRSRRRARRPRTARTSRRPCARSSGRRGQVDGRRRATRATASSRARRSPCGTARRSSSPSASRSQATKLAGDSAASIRTRDSAGWMRSSSASKSSAPSLGDDDLAVEHAALGQGRAERIGQLREVAVERLEVAGLGVDLVAVAEDERPEAVPLGLEQPAVVGRQRVDGLGEHRLDRRLDREVHRHGPSVPAEPGRSGRRLRDAVTVVGRDEPRRALRCAPSVPSSC